jgi:hypothetical protein
MRKRFCIALAVVLVLVAGVIVRRFERPHCERICL